MTKEQKEYAAKFLKNNPETKALFLNPKGEWFTDENYAKNSLEKDKDGKVKGKIETVKQGQAATEDDNNQK